MADEKTKLIEIIHKVAKQNNFENYELSVQLITSGGANYTSHLYVVDLKLKNNEVVHMFAKIAATGEKMRSQNPIKMYDTERYFYLKLLKIYTDIEEKNRIENEYRFKYPKFYGLSDNLYEETIVMENLKKKGYGDHDRMVSVDWAYASAAMKELARFHALSIVYKNQDPESFEKDSEELKINWDMGEEMQGYWNIHIQSAMNVASERNRDIIKRYSEGGLLDTEAYKKFMAPKKLGVLCHGDYRPSNLLHKKLEDGSVEIVPLDFQTVQYGTPVTDFLYFLITATDEEFRKNHYQDLVDLYHAELCNAMSRLGIDTGVFTIEDFREELKEKLYSTLAIAIFLLPIVTVEAENAPVVDENMDLDSFNIKNTSSLFSERLNGVINDLVQWGVVS